MYRLLILTALAASAPVAGNEVSATQAFERLSALQGKWTGTFANGKAHSVEYRLSAGGTALIETWTLGPTRESITMYALDGARLLATHYCPQGNQPRLKFTEVDAQGKYQFAFVDGTNLQNPEGWHQHTFWVSFDDATHYTRSETYVPNQGATETGAEEPVVYTRVGE